MIIIQTVEPFKLFGVSYDTIFTTVITITIFILGYFFNRLYEYRKDTRHLKDIRHLVLSHLSSLIEPIDKQIRVYKEFGEFLGTHKIEDYLFHASGIQTDFLSSIPYLDIFKAFLLKSKSKRVQYIDAFNSILQTIEFIRSQNENAKSQFQEFIINQKEHLDSWNIANGEILRYHSEILGYARRNRISPDKDTFLKELNEIIHNWYLQENGSEFKTKFKYLVKPVMNLVDKYQNDRRTVIISPFVIKSAQAYGELLDSLDIYSKIFIGHSINLAKRKEILVNTLELFQ